MKWVAYALALLALIIWGLSLTVPPQERALGDDGHRLPRVAKLQLASELPGPRHGPKSSSPEQSSSDLTSSASPSSVTRASSPTVAASSPLVSPGADASMPKGISGTGNKPDGTAQPAEASSPETAQPEVVKKAPKPISSPKPVSQCLVVTGLESKLQAENLINALAKAGANGQLRSRQESLPSLNWVLTEKYPSRHQALQALRHFQRRGIDSFLVTQGQWADAISLGLYQSSRLARDALHRLLRKGIKAHIEPYERSREVFSVRFHALSDKQAALLHKTVKPKQEGAEKEQIIACEGVASSGKSP